MQRLSRFVISCAAAFGLSSAAVAQTPDAPPPGATAAQPTGATAAPSRPGAPKDAGFLMASDLHHVEYACEGGKTLAVSYATVGDTPVATITLDGKTYLFANVISASGARYASGQYIWWNKGTTGFLTDETQPADHNMVYRDCAEAQ